MSNVVKEVKKKFENKQIRTIVLSCIVLVLGILFCFSLAMGELALSYIIGTALIIIGVLCVVSAYSNKKEFLNTDGVVGAAIIAFGILFAGNNLTYIIIHFIPFFLIAIGVIIVLDAFFKQFKDNKTSQFVIELIIGAASIALGFCLKFIPSFNQFCSIMLGVVLIVYSLYTLFITLAKKEGTENKKG